MIHTDDSQWAEFLDRLVHDLREPLRSIGVFSELLAETAKGRLGAEGDQVTGEILAGAAKMSYIRYLLYDILGGILWVWSMTLLGFTLDPLVVAPPPSDAETVQSLAQTAADLRSAAGSDTT